jgi:hypothetical protein
MKKTNNSITQIDTTPHTHQWQRPKDLYDQLQHCNKLSEIFGRYGYYQQEEKKELAFKSLASAGISQEALSRIEENILEILLAPNALRQFVNILQVKDVTDYKPKQTDKYKIPKGVMREIMKYYDIGIILVNIPDLTKFAKVCKDASFAFQVLGAYIA